MFKHQGIWLPDGEKHFPEWMTRNGEIVNGKGTYQIKKWRACIPHIKNWNTAIDIGGHVGLWSMHLQLRFLNVFAYEPVRAFRDCFIQNVGNFEDRAQQEGWGRGGHPHNVEVFPYALGRTDGMVKMNVNPADTGGTHVGKEPGDVPLKRLDDEFFHPVENVGFIKVDCEGYELDALAGAERLIRESKPCIIVEQKPHKLLPNFGIKGTPAVDFLKGLGYRVAKEIGGDYIMVQE